MDTFTWYKELIKPTWAPPSWLFGPVWSLLYSIIIVSFGAVFYKVFTKQIPLLVALPFALNIVFNAAFSPIQFSLKNNLLASLDIILVVITLIWALVSLWHASPELRWIVYVNIPYLLWGIFATCLQLTITYLNRSL
jgi:translocator protein